MIEIIAQWFCVAVAVAVASLSVYLQRRHNRERQTCWAYCPGCKLELTATPEAFLSDTEEGVRYLCPACGTGSLWSFDAPAPLLLWHSARVRRLRNRKPHPTDPDGYPYDPSGT